MLTSGVQSTLPSGTTGNHWRDGGAAGADPCGSVALCASLAVQSQGPRFSNFKTKGQKKGLTS